jgi:hypothetical protein
VRKYRYRKSRRGPNVGVVRCLGPGEEHTFLSRDRTRERICPACRDLIREKNFSQKREISTPPGFV